MRMLFSSSTGIGVSFQNGAFRAAEVKRLHGGGLGVVRLEEVALEAGLIEAGRILDVDKLSLLLKEALFVRGKGWKGKEVWCVLPESIVFFHLFVFPGIVSDAEIAQALPLQCEEVFPYPSNELTCAFDLVRRNEHGTLVACAAVRSEDLLAYEEVLRRVGVRSKGCLLPAQALSNVFFDAVPKGKAFAALYADADAVAFFWDNLGLRGSLFEDVGWSRLHQRLIKEEGLAPQKADALVKRLRSGKELAKKEEAIFSDMIDALAKHIARGVSWYAGQMEAAPIEVVLLSSSFPVVWQQALTEKTLAYIPKLRVRYATGTERFSVKSLAKKMGDISPWAAAMGAARLSLQPLPGLLPLSSDGSKQFSGASSTKHFWWMVLCAGVGIALVVAGFIVWQRQNSTIDQPTEEIPTIQEGAIEVPSADTPTEHTYVVSTNPVEGALPGRLAEAPVEVMVTIPPIGTPVDAIAEGVVVITNTTTSDQPLVATTRLLSKEGVLFRLREPVVVPSGGEVEARVYADVAGAAGNAEPTTFTIPGLPLAQQAQVYAASTEAFTGGIRTEIYWSKEVQEATKQAALEKAKKDSEIFFTSSLKPEEVILSLLSEYTFQEFIDEPVVDALLSDDLSLSAVVMVRTLVVNVENLPTAEQKFFKERPLEVQVEYLRDDWQEARLRISDAD